MTDGSELVKWRGLNNKIAALQASKERKLYLPFEGISALRGGLYCMQSVDHTQVSRFNPQNTKISLLEPYPFSLIYRISP
jgi:hypothetical protein